MVFVAALLTSLFAVTLLTPPVPAQVTEVHVQDDVAPFILVSTWNTIMKVALNGSNPQVLVTATGDITSLGYHYRRRQVFFLTEFPAGFYSFSLESSAAGEGSYETIKERDMSISAGLAVDWINDKVYWMNVASQSIEVYNIKNNTHETLLSFDSGEMPVGISILPYPDSGWLFAKVRRSSNFGVHGNTELFRIPVNDVSQKVKVHMALCGGNIMINPRSNELFWIDECMHELEASRMAGNCPVTFKSLGNPDSPSRFGFSTGISQYNNELYYTQTSGIYKLVPGEAPTLVLGRSRRRSFAALAIVHPSMQPPESELRPIGDEQGCPTPRPESDDSGAGSKESFTTDSRAPSLSTTTSPTTEGLTTLATTTEPTSTKSTTELVTTTASTTEPVTTISVTTEESKTTFVATTQESVTTELVTAESTTEATIVETTHSISTTADSTSTDDQSDRPVQTGGPMNGSDAGAGVLSTPAGGLNITPEESSSSMVLIVICICVLLFLVIIVGSASYLFITLFRYHRRRRGSYNVRKQHINEESCIPLARSSFRAFTDYHPSVFSGVNQSSQGLTLTGSSSVDSFERMSIGSPIVAPCRYQVTEAEIQPVEVAPIMFGEVLEEEIQPVAAATPEIVQVGSSTRSTSSAPAQASCKRDYASETLYASEQREMFFSL